MNLSVSIRPKPVESPALGFLQQAYPSYALTDIKSVYGFTPHFSPLYGGRQFSSRRGVTDIDIDELLSHGIYFHLPLTNHFVDRAAYEKEYDFLSSLHYQGNAVICVDAKLAQWIRKDFPKFSLVSSVIRNPSTILDIEESLGIFDFVVLPSRLNTDLLFLQQIKQKDRIVLFGNTTCLFNCTALSCYADVSRTMRGELDHVTNVCNRGKARKPNDYCTFNLQSFIDMGFSNFKLIMERRNHGNKNH